MTSVQYVEYIIDNNWEPSITGRAVDVPKPTILRESSANTRRLNLDESDVLIIRDGGISNYEPQSFGWGGERQVGRVTVDARTTGEAGSTEGRERLWGYRGGAGSLGANEAERYGGLQGEIKRILDTVRKGDQGYDIIRASEQNDLSGQMGGQIWRGTTEVILDTRAHQIDPTP